MFLLPYVALSYVVFSYVVLSYVALSHVAMSHVSYLSLLHALYHVVLSLFLPFSVLLISSLYSIYFLHSLSCYIPWSIFLTIPYQQTPYKKFTLSLINEHPLNSSHCIVGQKSQESRRKYWATRLSVRSFARTAHSLARGKVNF